MTLAARLHFKLAAAGLTENEVRRAFALCRGIRRGRRVALAEGLARIGVARRRAVAP